MNLENPYQPSQIAQLLDSATVVDEAWTPEDALGPRWLTVCKGAANCFTAVAIPVVSSFVAIGFLLLEYFFELNLPPRLYSVLGLGLLYALYLQMSGILRMSKIAAFSRAKTPLTIAAILFVLAVAIYMIYIISALILAQQLLQDNPFRESPQVKIRAHQEATIQQTMIGLVSFVIYIVYNFVLMFGIRRVALALHDRNAVRNITTSTLLFVATLVVIPVTMYLRIAESPRNSSSGTLNIVLLIAGLILIYIMLDFYGKALKKIADYAKTFAPVESAEKEAKSA